MKFLVTQNKDSADKLKDLGYKLFSCNNNTYIFENSPNKHFSKKDVADVLMTNRVFL